MPAILKTYDKATIHSTTDKGLDGQLVTVIGHFQEAHIIQFDNPVPGYDPAIVLTASCLTRVIGALSQNKIDRAFTK